MTTTTARGQRTDVFDAVRQLLLAGISEPRAEAETAAALVALARDHLPFDEAGIILRNRDGRLRTVVCTHPGIEPLDSLRAVDPEGGPPQARLTGAAFGLRGVVTIRLTEHACWTGVLNLYSSAAQPVTTHSLDVSRWFAYEASAALHVSNEVWHLHQALAHRCVIGQAQGFLMATYGIDADQALGVLKRISSQTQRKLREVASEIVTTHQVHAMVEGELPASG